MFFFGFVVLFFGDLGVFGVCWRVGVCAGGLSVFFLFLVCWVLGFLGFFLWVFFSLGLLFFSFFVFGFVCLWFFCFFACFLFFLVFGFFIL